MTNKEKYKQAFSAIQTSRNFNIEVNEMKKVNKQYKSKTMIASVVVFTMIMIGATVAYATDFSGFQRTVHLWIHGDKTEVTIQLDGNGTYSMDYVDEENDMKYQNGGGVSFGVDGKETPLSDEELLECLTRPEVSYEEDGTVHVYWFDKKIDITDKFENNVCYVKLINGNDILYMTIMYHNGFKTSPSEYLSPDNVDL